MNVYRYKFRPDRLQGATIFKIPQQIVRVYATDTFVRRAEEARLAGIEYERIWTAATT